MDYKMKASDVRATKTLLRSGIPVYTEIGGKTIEIKSILENGEYVMINDLIWVKIKRRK